jgi:hypothetical protein
VTPLSKPADDPIGTVRRATVNGKVFVKSDDHGLPVWNRVFGADNRSYHEKCASEALSHSVVIGVVPGTPAANGAISPELERLREQCAMHERIRFEVEEVLDRALGTKESDGAGAGLVADVALLAERLDKVRQALKTPAEGWAVQLHALHVRQERDRAVAARDALSGLLHSMARRATELRRQYRSLSRSYVRLGAERDEKQFEVERLRRWVKRFRAGLRTVTAQLAAATATPSPDERAELLRLINERGVQDLDAEELADDVTQLLRPEGSGCWAEDGAALTNESSISPFAPVSESVPATPECKEQAGNLNLDGEIQGNLHKVAVERRESMFYATCGHCARNTQSHNEAYVRNWATRHEAEAARSSGVDLPEVEATPVAEVAAETLNTLVARLRDLCSRWDSEHGACTDVPDAACRVRGVIGLSLIEAQNRVAAVAPPAAELQANSKSEQILDVAPPAAASADTTPRVWAVGSPEPDESVTKLLGENDVTFTRTAWGRWLAQPPEGNGRDYPWAELNGLMVLTEVLPNTKQETER